LYLRKDDREFPGVRHYDKAFQGHQLYRDTTRFAAVAVPEIFYFFNTNEGDCQQGIAALTADSTLQR